MKKSTRLITKARKALDALREIEYSQGTRLFFEAQKGYTKNALWGAIDKLREFIDNIDNETEE